MRLSLCQVIVVLCALSIGILTVTPFVSTTEADDYWAEIDFNIKIQTCNRGYSHGQVITDTNPTLFRFHEPQTHDPSAHSIVYNYYYSKGTVTCDGRDHDGGNGISYTWG